MNLNQFPKNCVFILHCNRDMYISHTPHKGTEAVPACGPAIEMKFLTCQDVKGVQHLVIYTVEHYLLNLESESKLSEH